VDTTVDRSRIALHGSCDSEAAFRPPGRYRDLHASARGFVHRRKFRHLAACSQYQLTRRRLPGTPQHGRGTRRHDWRPRGGRRGEALGECCLKVLGRLLEAADQKRGIFSDMNTLRIRNTSTPSPKVRIPAGENGEKGAAGSPKGAGTGAPHRLNIARVGRNQPRHLEGRTGPLGGQARRGTYGGRANASY
jgi:hypothetical protein